MAENFMIFDPTNGDYAGGAPPDGSMDAAPAFTAALKAAGDNAAGTEPSGSSIVQAPPGLFLFDGRNGISSLSIPPGVALQGSNNQPTSHGRDGTITDKTQVDGTIFLITASRGSDTPTFCQLSSNSAVRGISFQWPDQALNMHPMHYPFAVGADPNASGVITDATIEDIELLNAFRGIDLTNMDRHTVRNVIGQAFCIGVRIDRCPNGGSLKDVHFSTLWTGFTQMPDGSVLPFLARSQYALATAFWVKGTKNQRLTNCTAQGYAFGVRVQPGASINFAPKYQFQGIRIVNCPRGIQLAATDPRAEVQFTNLVIAGETRGPRRPGTPGVAIFIDPAFTARARFTNGLIEGNLPALQVGGGVVLVSDFTFKDDQLGPGLGPGVYTITGTGGSLSLTGCEFLRADTHVFLGSTMTNALLVGNLVTNAAATGLDVNGQAQNTLIANNL